MEYSQKMANDCCFRREYVSTTLRFLVRSLAVASPSLPRPALIIDRAEGRPQDTACDVARDNPTPR